MNNKQSFAELNWPTANSDRHYLPIFLDFQLCYTFFTLVHRILHYFDFRVINSWTYKTHFWMSLLFILAIILTRTFFWSPGKWALGIQPMRSGFNRQKFVDPVIKNTESWWTICLGLLLVYAGAKMAIRETFWHPLSPFIGVQLDSVSSLILALVTGFLLCIIGFGVLRCQVKAAVVGIMIFGVLFLSNILTYELWMPSAADSVLVCDNEHQGAIREREKTFLHERTDLRTKLLFTPMLMGLYCLAAARRFRHGGRPNIRAGMKGLGVAFLVVMLGVVAGSVTLWLFGKLMDLSAWHAWWGPCGPRTALGEALYMLELTIPCIVGFWTAIKSYRWYLRRTTAPHVETIVAEVK